MAIEKIKVTDTSVIEQIRNSLPTANINKNGLMDFKDKKRGFCWESQAGEGKTLFVGKFPRTKSISFSAISGNNSSLVTSDPTPLIIAINNYDGKIRSAKIGSGNKWAYKDDGKDINLYYQCSPYVGDGVFIISYSHVELIMEFINTPSDLVFI
ncbi:hypothetical protein [Bacteroides cellulosilyticus]|uniref:hypothetical protein n=1 Tax=Bacteroides cellulosilyticus TaxID=246787 RepID=UPI00356902F5